MADGTSRPDAITTAASARLDGAGDRIWAHCRCGRAAAIDPTPWRAQGLGAAPLDHLEGRLRCLCGARCVPIDLSPPAEGRAGGGIWVFR